MGHSFVMKRTDTYLFKTIKETAPNLIKEWLKNKDLYKSEYEKLRQTDRPLFKAIKLYVFDVLHDRGYQYHIALLRQQFRAEKNLHNLKTKILRGNFKDLVDDDILNNMDNIDKARLWLLELTDRLLIADNIEKITLYKNRKYTVKKSMNKIMYRSVKIAKTNISNTFLCIFCTYMQ